MEGQARMRIRNKYFGDRTFYRTVFALVLPLVIQQGITTFVNLLDNVMVGALGTEAISAVAIVNQLVFVFNLTIFGGYSGAAIYGAQYAGKGEHDGVRATFRFKFVLGLAVAALAFAGMAIFGDRLIALYLTDDGSSAAAIAATMAEARGYLDVIIWGFWPYVIFMAYASTLRETGEVRAPMIASVASIVVNLVLNYALIYGRLGAPALGVRGAAIATVIARYVELGMLLAYLLTHRGKHPFTKGALRSLRIPGEIVKKICITGAPLLLNEFLWSTGMAWINQCYSVRGLATVAAVNINATVWNVFTIIMFGMGSAISILVGQRLGRGDIEGAKAVDRQLITFDVLIHIGIGLLAIALARVIPEIYRTDTEVKRLASQLLVVAGATLPLNALTHAIYFTIRSGGRTVMTFLFDSVFTCAVLLPIAFFLARYTALPTPLVYAAGQLAMVLKLAIAAPLMLSGAWARNVIDKTETTETETAA